MHQALPVYATTVFFYFYGRVVIMYDWTLAFDQLAINWQETLPRLLHL